MMPVRTKIALAERVLGWQPKVTLDQALVHAIDYLSAPYIGHIEAMMAAQVQRSID